MGPHAPPTAAVPSPVSQSRGVRRTAVLALAGLAAGALVGWGLTQRPSDPGPAAAAAAAPAATTTSERLAALHAAVEEDPADVAAWRTLATVAVTRAAEVGDPTYYDVAGRALTRAEALAPDAPGTAIGRGVLALARHEFDDALRHGRRALRDLPANASALAVVTDAQIELGDYDAAQALVEQLLDRRPGVAALARVSYLRELRGDVGGAAQAMAGAHQAAAVPSDRAGIAALRGDLAMLLGAVDDAADHYTQALDDMPDLVAASVGMARVTAARGDVEQAVQDLEVLVDRRPQPDAVALLGDLQQRLGHDDDAAASRALVRTLTDLQTRHGQVADLELAVYEADRGDDPQRAVALARRAYDARPDSIYAADALAWALARAGRARAALPLVDDALRLDSADPVLRFHAAWILAEAGRPAAARRQLDRVAQTTPWFSFAYLDDAGELATELGMDVPAAWR